MRGGDGGGVEAVVRKSWWERGGGGEGTGEGVMWGGGRGLTNVCILIQLLIIRFIHPLTEKGKGGRQRERAERTLHHITTQQSVGS